jgi:RNA polymerase sigma-70 factor (ECF subfamily)
VNPHSTLRWATLTDEAIMRLLQRGDSDAFAELYARYHGKISRRAQVLCDTREGAEEAAQDAFVDLWRSRDVFDYDRGSIQTWLYALVHNRSIDVHRRGRRALAVCEGDEEFDLVAAPGSVEHDAERRDDGDRLRASLGRLPAAQREVVVLAFFGELTHLEIADRLNLPLGTVKGRMRLGMRRARSEIDRDGRARPEARASSPVCP